MSEPAAEKALWRYLRNVAIALDQLGNALTGGDPKETMSYRAAVARAAGSDFACRFCRALDLFEADHCGKTLARHNTEALPGSP